MLHITHAHAQWFLLGGRILLGLIFVVAGLQKLVGGIAPLASTIDAVTGLPFPSLVAAMVIAVELGGGLLFMAGYFTRRAALAIVVFVVLATFFFHPAWSKSTEIMPMLKNLAIIGGLFAYLAAGPGEMSLDARLRGHRSQKTPQN